MDGDEILKAELQKALSECQRLRDENAQLRLRIHQSDTVTPKPEQLTANADNRAQSPSPLTNDSRPEAKVSLFRSLFRGRDDVYAVRWEGRSGKAGYAPAGIREWNQSLSTKRGAKQSFHYNKLFPLSDEVIRDHLLGKQTIGVYPLLQDDTCWFVAVDFDKTSWEADACAFLKMCQEVALPASLERSRSGNGGHVWIFFASPIHAALARKLASAVLTRTMERHYAMGLDSYDRLFPSQDTMPKGGFGNLIALPLQHGPRENSNSVFVDDGLRPHHDQWSFLSSIKRLSQDDIQAILRRLYPVGDVINIKYSASDYNEESDPWILPPSGQLPARDITEALPQTVSINLGNQIYIEKKGLPDVFLDRLIRLAAFQNPEFYKTQAMRLSTFGKPRVIACAEDLPRYMALPRGLLQEVLNLFRTQNIPVDVTDHRFSGVPFQVEFHGERRSRQTEAAKALASWDDGILCAPTAFGKTAVAAQLIAMRKVNTLVLVHRRHLMDQWRERLARFLGLSTKDIGQIGSGKTRQTGRLDVAVHRRHESKRVVRVYDYVDVSVPMLNRMYEKRLKAYKAVGYSVARPLGELEVQAGLRFAAIERIAVQAAIAFEEARGCKVESVESDTRGFDLISRRMVSDTARERIETRFIEVKGRAAVGEIALTANEYKTAQRLGDDYWLYVAFNCASQPQVTLIQNPARFDWEPLSKIDCYRIAAETLLNNVRAVEID